MPTLEGVDVGGEGQHGPLSSISASPTSPRTTHMDILRDQRGGLSGTQVDRVHGTKLRYGFYGD